MFRLISVDTDIFVVVNLLNRTKNVGFASGVVTDATGKVYTSGPATCMI